MIASNQLAGRLTVAMRLPLCVSLTCIPSIRPSVLAIASLSDGLGLLDDEAPNRRFMVVGGSRCRLYERFARAPMHAVDSACAGTLL